MSWRDQALEDIKQAEACRLEAYLDSEKVWTIGYGHTYGVKPGDTCTKAQAESWFQFDVGCSEVDLIRNLDWWIGAPGAVKRGLLNMSFNLGWPRLVGFKKMLEAGRVGAWEEMGNQALDSQWASQVGERAFHVANLFKSAGNLVNV